MYCIYRFLHLRRNIAKYVYKSMSNKRYSGFCLGYLRGRSFPQKMPSFLPKVLLSLQYISNCNGKIIQTRRASQCTWSKYSLSGDTTVSQNAPDCISAHIHFKNFPEGMHYPTLYICGILSSYFFKGFFWVILKDFEFTGIAPKTAFKDDSIVAFISNTLISFV